LALDLNSIKRDFKREDEGDWVDYPDWEGVRFKVRSFSFPPYQAAHTRMLRRLSKEAKGKPIPERALLVEQGALIADHLLSGWEGMVQPYAVDTARAYLTDPEFAELIGAVTWCCNKLAETNAKFVEDTEKNSAAPSATN
jgi:hypothetical protein